jgi:hypothetical protein
MGAFNDLEADYLGSHKAVVAEVGKLLRELVDAPNPIAWTPARVKLLVEYLESQNDQYLPRLQVLEEHFAEASTLVEEYGEALAFYATNENWVHQANGHRFPIVQKQETKDYTVAYIDPAWMPDEGRTATMALCRGDGKLFLEARRERGWFEEPGKTPEDQAKERYEFGWSDRQARTIMRRVYEEEPTQGEALHTPPTQEDPPTQHVETVTFMDGSEVRVATFEDAKANPETLAQFAAEQVGEFFLEPEDPKPLPPTLLRPGQVVVHDMGRGWPVLVYLGKERTVQVGTSVTNEGAEDE